MKFRKKPVIVEAFQLTREQGEGDKKEWPAWLYQAWINKVLFYVGYGELGVYGIKTLEGDLTVNYGAFIIQGVKGELYPCDPDIFEATYEPIEC
jgi:hypothetical protein